MTCHNFISFTIDQIFYDLPKAKREAFKKEFLKIIKNEKNVVTSSYATLGLKTHATILFWIQADAVETIQNFLNTVMHTRLGRYLHITHTLFGMTRPTQYSPKSVVNEDTSRKGGKYLIIYPFTKTKEWHMLDFEKRKNLMWGHVSIGKKYNAAITQLLLYSFGVDDSEFIVSYETDDLAAFQSLVMELRTDKVRAYTLKDTPIFLCVYKSLQELAAFL